jgi:hypothetical protein
MIVHYDANPSVTSPVNEISASSLYYSSWNILCDGAPAQSVVPATGRATFICPDTTPGDHTFEIQGTLVSD